MTIRRVAISLTPQTNSSSENEVYKHLDRADRARKVVQEQGVKLHRFLPSNRTIWTVVGRESDFLIDFDPKGKSKPFCSCDDFHFRVLSGRVPDCYHLLAAKEAVSSGLYSVIDFRDDEMSDFLKALISDMFQHIC